MNANSIITKITERFETQFNPNKRDWWSQTKWNERVLEVLCAVGTEDFNCRVWTESGMPNSHGGEWLYDQTSTWWEDKGDPYYDWKNGWSVPMVAECEWGSNDGLILIAEDFEKLLQARTDLRVFIFDSVKWNDGNNLDSKVKKFCQWIGYFKKSKKGDMYLLIAYEKEKPPRNWRFFTISSNGYRKEANIMIMPTIVEVLKKDRELYPNWLKYTPTPFDRDNFFSSRNVFYPGSGNDGQPVKFCAQAHAAHTFVYVDYRIDRETIGKRLYDPQDKFLGYSIYYEEELTESDLVPKGWNPHISYAQIPYYQNRINEIEFVPFALYMVLERDDGYDEDHGPKRIAGLFIGGEGFATFDKLYCQKYEVADPYLILIQDYAFGHEIKGQKFGRGGLLETIAHKCNKRPTWLLVGETSAPWDEYDDSGAAPKRGGEGRIRRRLYRIDSTNSVS